MRPVEQVSWNMIRGDSSIYNWPGSASVDPDSFAGRIQTLTGLNLDLPTEAQWEYACRAGTTSEYNNGSNSTNDLRFLGRYYDNTTDGKGGYSSGHTTVGSYLPNAWGLYDMHGNVYEWCLDWSAYLSGNTTDPVGASSGANRVCRGGWYLGQPEECTSSYGGGSSPSNEYGFIGFRLCCPVE